MLFTASQLLLQVIVYYHMLICLGNNGPKLMFSLALRTAPKTGLRISDVFCALLFHILIQSCTFSPFSFRRTHNWHCRWDGIRRRRSAGRPYNGSRVPLIVWSREHSASLSSGIDLDWLTLLLNGCWGRQLFRHLLYTSAPARPVDPTTHSLCVMKFDRQSMCVMITISRRFRIDTCPSHVSCRCWRKINHFCLVNWMLFILQLAIDLCVNPIHN